MKRSRVAVVALFLIIGACTDGRASVEEAGEITASTPTTTTSAPTTEAPPTTSTTSTTSTSPTTTSTTSTTTTAPPTTVVAGPPFELVTEAGLEFTDALSLEVLAPLASAPDPAGWPTLVVFHGGSWVSGAADDIRPLAMSLAQQGAVVFNAPYRLAFRGGGYPNSIDDVACAMRFVRARTAQFGGNPDMAILVGYSAGAHLGSIVAFDGDEYGAGCIEDGSALPDGLVGAAGVYDIEPLGLTLFPFFGTSPDDDPESWADGNPVTHIGGNEGLVIAMTVGDEDFLRPLSDDFLRRVEDAGYEATLTIAEGADHFSIYNPDLDGKAVIDAVGEVVAKLGSEPADS